MLSGNVVAVDFDPRHWVNLIGLFDGEGPKKTFLLIFVENETCVKALHSVKGALLGFRFAGMEHLEKIRRENEVDVVGVVPADLLGKIFTSAQEQISHDDDWDVQILTLVNAVKPFIRNDIVWHPVLPISLPAGLSAARIEKLAHRFWPDETCLGFFVFEGRRPYTSLILGKKDKKIVLMTTLDAFGLAEGPLEWRTQWSTVSKLCEDRFMPLHAALFIETECLREMLAGPRALSFLHLSTKRGRALIAPLPFFWRWAMFLARKFGGQ